MNYRISRNGQMFGPYSDAEVAAYLATGNIAPSDLAQEEGTEEWIAVGDLYPATPIASAAPVPPPYPRAVAALYPDPPDFPWWGALLLGVLSGGVFFVLWDVVEAAWLHRIDRTSKALWLYLCWAAVYLVRLPATWHSVSYNMLGGPYYDYPHAVGLGLLSLLLALASRFAFRSELLRHFNAVEPIGLRLGWFMTLFFGGLYFQYHFNRINEVKRALRVSVP